MTNTRTIARNTGWYGLENAISFVVGLSTSIAIARTLGPTKMGYIIYVIWIASVVSSWAEWAFRQPRGNTWPSSLAWATVERQDSFIFAPCCFRRA